MIEQKITMQQLGKYALGALVGVALLVGLFFGIKAIVHQITMERPHFTTGKVVQKDFNPAHYDDWISQQYAGQTCSGSGNSRSCTSIYVPVYHHDYVPDAWSIQIQNCNVLHKDGRQWVDKQGNNRCFKKWVNLDHTTYDGLKLESEWGG